VRNRIGDAGAGCPVRQGGRRRSGGADGRDSKTASGKDIEFKVCAAEDLDRLEGVEHGSVDLVTAAMAVSSVCCWRMMSKTCEGVYTMLTVGAAVSQAHWFDMSKFWAAAAKVLRPGGSVVLWTHASLYCREFHSLRSPF
jgi:trans-aconitate 3-methyltransferase